MYVEKEKRIVSKPMREYRVCALNSPSQPTESLSTCCPSTGSLQPHVRKTSPPLHLQIPAFRHSQVKLSRCSMTPSFTELSKLNLDEAETKFKSDVAYVT